MDNNIPKTTKCKNPKLPLFSKLLISAHNFANSICFRSDGSVNRRLFNLLYPKVSAPTTTVCGGTTVSSSDVAVDPSRNLWFRLFIPKSPSDDDQTHAISSEQPPLPLIVYIHGGGFNSFSPDESMFHHLCCRIAANVPAIVASVNYRLMPEHRYPCAYDDCFDALKFIDDQNDAVFPPNTDFGRCFLAGDSAGGNIAHHVAVRACKNADGFRRLKPVGLIALQPFFGGEERTESELRLRNDKILNLKYTDMLWRVFLPDGESRDHEAAHVFNEELPENFPVTLLVIGGFDLLQDWQRRYNEMLKKCGVEVRVVEYPNAIHGFYTYPKIPESSMLLEEIKAFINPTN